jgi:hypothetical protein
MLRSGLAAVVLALASMGGAARAQSSEPYQLVIVPGASQIGEDAIRVDVATGQSMLSANQQPFIPITDPTPVGRGVYHLYPWSTFDSTAANRAWDVVRFDSQSGRLWHLVYDGKTTASWSEIVAAH